MRKSNYNPAQHLPKGQNGGGRKPVPIELWKDGSFIKCFQTITQAAQWLETTQSNVSMAMIRGNRIKGFDVKISEPIDVLLRKIAEENKKPYQFSRKP